MKKLWLIGVLLFSFAGIWIVSAQDDSCDVLSNEVLLSVTDVCSSVDADMACIGSDGVSIGDVEEAGKVIALGDIETIESSQTGVTLLNASMGLEDTSLRMILFGEAELSNTTQSVATDLVELPLTNIAGYTVNLRGGPGTNNPVVGTLDEDIEIMTDGRSEDSQWFRIMTADGIAWVHTSLVSVDGDIESLAVLGSNFTAPLQSMVLSTASDDELCGVSNSGLLLELNSETTLQLQVNGVELLFNQAIMQLRAAAENGLQVLLIDGAVEVKMLDGAINLTGGESATVRLDESLMVAGAPQNNGLYDFADIASAPLSLLAVDEMVCVAGLGTLDEQVSAYGGPGNDFLVVTEIDSNGHYTVTGFASSEDDQTWWQLESSGGYQSWVLQDNIRTAGMCNNIAEVEAPTDVTAGTNSSPATNTTFLPAEQSVWQATSGQDVMTGSCENEQPMAICNHLVALIPNGDGSLMWRGQEPTPYLMTPTNTNTYVHQGRNYQNTGNISMQMTLTSEGSWQMTWTTIFDANPACTHTFYYTATRQW